MKKYRIKLLALVGVLVFAMSFFACQKTENALLSEFKDITETAPNLQGMNEAVSFMEINIAEVSEEGGSRMVLAYEDYMLRFLDENVEPVEQAIVEPLFFSISDKDGTMNLSIDYDSLLEAYGDYISVELKELLTIKAEEAAMPSTEDAQIKLTYPDLLERALRTETLLLQHKSEDSLRANAVEYYEDYLFLLLAGTDYSPLFDYTTGEFSPAAKEAYEDFIVANPDTVLASTLTEYFSYLNDIKFIIDYNDPTENKVFYDTCDYLIQDALQRLK